MITSINVEKNVSTAGRSELYKPIVSTIELRNRKADIDNALFKIFGNKKFYLYLQLIQTFL